MLSFIHFTITQSTATQLLNSHTIKIFSLSSARRETLEAPSLRASNQIRSPASPLAASSPCSGSCAGCSVEGARGAADCEWAAGLTSKRRPALADLYCRCRQKRKASSNTKTWGHRARQTAAIRMAHARQFQLMNDYRTRTAVCQGAEVSFLWRGRPRAKTDATITAPAATAAVGKAPSDSAATSGCARLLGAAGRSGVVAKACGKEGRQ